VVERFGGASRDRTDDLIVANDALSQLSYSPVQGWIGNTGILSAFRNVHQTDPPIQFSRRAFPAFSANRPRPLRLRLLFDFTRKMAKPYVILGPIQPLPPFSLDSNLTNHLDETLRPASN
jgi:hypothetical protein